MSKLSQILRNVMRDNSANAAVISAFSLLAMIGGAGLATDTIQWTLWKRQLQRISDSAAISGAMSLARGGSASAAATSEINRYTIITLSGAPTIQTPPTAGPYSGNAMAVRVITTSSRTLPFSSMFMAATPVIRAEATAAAVGFGNYCVISLETTTATGVTFQGSSVVNLGCGVATNSQGSTAIIAGGGSSVTASPVSAVGVVPTSNNYAAGTVLNSYTIAQPDPYANIPLPSGYSCSGELQVNSNQTRNINNSTGVQCYRGMDLKGTVNFDPGTYIIDGSSGSTLRVGAGAVVRCTGCTFIFTTTSGDMTTIPTVTMNGNSTWQVTAPDTGTYAGIMMYQDRRGTATGSNIITGDNASVMRGAIYFPDQQVTFTGSSAMDTHCIQIVARTVTFTGNNYISNTCPPGGASHDVAGIQIRLVN